MNKLQQIIFNIIEEMEWSDAYGSLPAPSITVNNVLNNTDSYASGSNVIPNKNIPIQKRNFPELINTNKKQKKKKKKNGKQK